MADLKSEPHPVKNVADLGELMCYYTHEKMKEAGDVAERSSGRSMKADVHQGSDKTAADDLGITFGRGPTSSIADCYIAERRQQWLDLLKDGEKETLKNRKAADEAESFLHRMKLDADNKRCRRRHLKSTDSWPWPRPTARRWWN